jgi:hypothetical protein
MLISKRTKASIACWIISVVVALAVIIPLRLFSSFGLSNSCLVVGLVYLGLIFFIYVNRWGMFDTFRFQFINFCYSFRKGAPHKYKDAYSYQESMASKREESHPIWIPWVVIGGLCLILAIVFAFYPV